MSVIALMGPEGGMMYVRAESVVALSESFMIPTVYVCAVREVRLGSKWVLIQDTEENVARIVEAMNS